MFDHLARIEPYGKDQEGRVLSLGWKLAFNFSLLAVPMMIVGFAAPALGLIASFGSGRTVIAAAIAIPAVFAAQIAWAGTYPEWPMNQWLWLRLRRACRRRQSGRRRHHSGGRSHPAGTPSGEDATAISDTTVSDTGWMSHARMVEWVERSSWNATKLDTAKDVMLIRIDGDCLFMDGDRFRYTIPGESIIDAAVESVRPGGCFHQLHFLVLTVRTAEGPLEIPLAYRDHRFGRLHSSHRLYETQQLRDRIQSIATGGDRGFTDPDYPVIDHVDHAHQQVKRPMTGVLGAKLVEAKENPYAAPRSL